MRGTRTREPLPTRPSLAVAVAALLLLSLLLHGTNAQEKAKAQGRKRPATFANNDPLQEAYDYIVVGAGVSGGVLASR